MTSNTESELEMGTTNSTLKAEKESVTRQTRAKSKSLMGKMFNFSSSPSFLMMREEVHEMKDEVHDTRSRIYQILCLGILLALCTLCTMSFIAYEFGTKLATEISGEQLVNSETGAAVTVQTERPSAGPLASLIYVDFSWLQNVDTIAFRTSVKIGNSSEPSNVDFLMKVESAYRTEDGKTSLHGTGGKSTFYIDGSNGVGFFIPTATYTDSNLCKDGCSVNLTSHVTNHSSALLEAHGRLLASGGNAYVDNTNYGQVNYKNQLNKKTRVIYHENRGWWWWDKWYWEKYTHSDGCQKTPYWWWSRRIRSPKKSACTCPPGFIQHVFCEDDYSVNYDPYAYLNSALSSSEIPSNLRDVINVHSLTKQTCVPDTSSSIVENIPDEAYCDGNTYGVSTKVFKWDQKDNVPAPPDCDADTVPLPCNYGECKTDAKGNPYSVSKSCYESCPIFGDWTCRTDGKGRLLKESSDAEQKSEQRRKLGAPQCKIDGWMSSRQCGKPCNKKAQKLLAITLTEIFDASSGLYDAGNSWSFHPCKSCLTDFTAAERAMSSKERTTFRQNTIAEQCWLPYSCRLDGNPETYEFPKSANEVESRTETKVICSPLEGGKYGQFVQIENNKVKNHVRPNDCEYRKDYSFCKNRQWNDENSCDPKNQASRWNNPQGSCKPRWTIGGKTHDVIRYKVKDTYPN